MKQEITKAIQQLNRDHEEVDSGNYADHYIVLIKLIALVELIGSDKYDEMFWHCYKAAKNYINFKPGREDDEAHLPGIQRELDYLIPHLQIN